jgi:predicted ATPase
LIAIPGADIISFDTSPISHIGYEETESYRVTELFINHREMMVKNLTDV